MPLWIEDKPYSDPISSVREFLEENQHFKASAGHLKAQHTTVVKQPKLLYVNQREYAIVSPQDEHIDILGTDDATTCHMVILRHSGSGVTGLAHCDGCNTETAINSMVSIVQKLSHGSPEGRLEISLIGGFIDDKKESQKLSKEVLELLQKQEADVHLICASITDNNTVVKDNVRFPVIYGIAVEVKTGKIFPATFASNGPEIYVRSACHFGGCRDMMNIYDNEKGHLVIGPYDWEPWDQVSKWIELPDQIIRKYLSTSPEQEPPYFESHVRESLKVLEAHPNPMLTLFPDGKSHRYSLSEDGTWICVTES